MTAASVSASDYSDEPRIGEEAPPDRVDQKDGNAFVIAVGGLRISAQVEPPLIWVDLIDGRWDDAAVFIDDRLSPEPRIGDA